jgi:cell division septation protein DedD
MKKGVGQRVCFVVGVLLLSTGGGLLGGRWAFQRQVVLTPQSTSEAPAGVEEFEGADSPTAPESVSATPQKRREDDRQSLFSPRSSVQEGTKATETATKRAGKQSSEPALSKYVIQVISTSSRPDARNTRRKIVAEGFPAGIFEVDLGEKGRWYRVYVGPYDAETEARTALESVRKIPGFKASFVKSLE